MDLLYKANNYPPASRFYALLKENGIKATHAQVKEFIEKQDIHQVNKSVAKRKSKYKHFTASYPNEIFQIDLLDYQKYSQQNRGFNWILICIDVFTRKAYAKPLKNKTAILVKNAFEEIKETPAVVFHDEGGEFKGSFLEYMKEKNIINVESDKGNHTSLGIVDRFSRTLKTEISKHMTANNTTIWYNQLDKLLQLYNNKPHEGIAKLKPNNIEGDKENEIVVSTLNFKKQIESHKIQQNQTIFKVGDLVRIQIQRGTFTKGYEITYTKEIYTVETIKNSEATLNNKKTYKFTQLQKIPDGSTDTIKSGKKETSDKKAKIERLLRKEGLK